MIRPRLKKILLWGSASLLVLVLLLATAVWFLAGTQGGTRWLFTRLGALVPGSLEVAQLNGPLRGPLDIRGLHYRTEGLDVLVDRVRFDWKLREIAHRQLDIQRLYADGVHVLTTPSEEKKKRGPLPDMNLRFNILVRDARVRGLTIESKRPAPGEKPFVIDRIDLATTDIRNAVRVDALTVRSALFDADVTGSLHPQGDYPVDLNVRWAYRAPDMAPFSGHGRLTGTLEQLRVEQTLAAPFPVQVSADLLQPLYDLRFDARARFSDANPRQIKADLPDLPATGEIAAKGTIDEMTGSGNVRAVVPQVGPVQTSLRFARAFEVWTVEHADVALPGTPTRATASGKVAIHPGAASPDLQADVNWWNLSWPLRGAPKTVTSRRGSARLSGSLDHYRAAVQADVADPAGKIPPGHWNVEGSGTPERFAFTSLRGDVLAGRVTGRGEVAWKPAVRWNAELRGDGIDPSRIAPQVPGRVAFALTSRGTMTAAGPVGEVHVSRLEGSLRGQPVRAVADVRLAGDRQQISKLDATWSDARLSAAGWIGKAFDLSWDLTAPNLGVMVPQGGGSVLAQGHVSGPLATPRIQATARGQGLLVGTNSFASTDLTADVDLAPTGVVALDLHSTGVQSGNRRIDDLTVRARGVRTSHQIQVAARNQQGRLDLALAGGLVGTTAWRGQIRQLDLRAKPTGDWSLTQPAALSASTGGVDLRGFCWGSADGGKARLCADGGWAKTGGWNVDSRIADLPLDRFKPFLPTDLVITGNLNGHAAARGNGADLLMADVDLRPGPGELRFPGREGQTVTFRYTDGVLQARAGAGGAGVATANLTFVDAGTMSARMNLPRFRPGTPLGRQPLAGRIDVQLTNLAFVEGFVPDVQNLGGTLTGGYQLSGTVGSPRFVGEARLAGGKADVARLGIQLRDLKLAATGNGTGALALDGSVRSGKGTLTIRGQAGVPSPETPIRLAIQGRSFQAMNTEEIKAVVSPDLTLSYEGKVAKVEGQVDIPSADVNIEKREKGPVKTSQDVVFVNAAQDAAPRNQLGVVARVRFVLGKDVQINVLGLKAKPTGSILALEDPGKVTRGVGELELTGGTFKAYGQDLTIERGRVVFAGGPIDNPGLDVRAYRKATDGTTAGIEAKGTIRTPEVTLWSDPAMGQSEQLAYLLTGKPLGQASPEEGSRLANAATALGLRGGNLVAKKLAARFGLEEARIESSGSIQQASLVVGKYLSPKLYVVYGLGIFEPVNTFRVRYLLNDRWTLQAESGGSATGADALYTVERGGPKPKKMDEPTHESPPGGTGPKAGGGP
jgi:translocation and assembly module TamB